MLFKFKSEIEQYKKQYSTEYVLFEELGPQAKKNGFLTQEEFLKICLWKTPRAKKKYLDNTKETIEKTTKKAFAETNEIKKIQTLCKLNGVGIPVASAILTVINPKKYGVIDIRCIQTLKENGYEKEFPNKSISEKRWKRYVEILNELSKNFNCKPREVEMAIFAKNREDHPENLYKDKTKAGKIAKI